MDRATLTLVDKIDISSSTRLGRFLRLFSLLCRCRLDHGLLATEDVERMEDEERKELECDIARSNRWDVDDHGR